MGFISITLEAPGSAIVKRSRGGLQFMASALEENLKTSSIQVQKAITAAIQHAADETKEIAVNALSQRVACDRRLIEARVASRRVTIKQSSWEIRIKQKPIDLKHFNPEQSKAGVRVNTGNGTKLYRKAFGPDIKRLGGNVFRRLTKDSLPIKKVPGVSLVAVANRIKLQERLKREFYHRARIRIKRNMALVAFLGNEARGFYGVR